MSYKKINLLVNQLVQTQPVEKKQSMVENNPEQNGTI